MYENNIKEQIENKNKNSNNLEKINKTNNINKDTEKIFIYSKKVLSKEINNRNENNKNINKNDKNINQSKKINANKINSFFQENEKVYFINNQKYNIKLYGFLNSSNNCYINSSLQLLSRINDLNEYILNYDIKKINKNNITKGKLFIEFQIILNKIKMNERNIDPNDLKNVMGKIDERYKYNNQEDSNEFITNFLNNLLEETSDKNKFVIKIII